MELYRPILKKFDNFSSNHWIDLASGSGLPALYVHKSKSKQVVFQLTDLYPDSVSSEVLLYLKRELEPVNILNFQPQAYRQYSMFNAFHHFTSDQQRHLVEKMKHANAGFLFVEVLEPSLLSFFQVTLAAVIIQPVIAWMIRPFSLLRLVCTYLLPIQLFTVAWDGWISVLKSKTLSQYQELARDISDNKYVIQVERIKQIRGNLILLSAHPIPL
ncbi:MAG: hypothetical protein O2814_02355 [Bacteroidetes bacterium]|nr:hypothetical protein [Bacteroidota bacterium]MDA1223954.1 hypothetical protein [Bacteroidota bacterium]